MDKFLKKLIYHGSLGVHFCLCFNSKYFHGIYQGSKAGNYGDSLFLLLIYMQMQARGRCLYIHHIKPFNTNNQPIEVKII